MESFSRDPERVVDAPDTRPGTSHWVCDVDSLEVYEVISPDGTEDPCFSGDSLAELLGKVNYAKHTGQLSEYAVAHFAEHILGEMDRMENAHAA